jgi:hypothetical protein
MKEQRGCTTFPLEQSSFGEAHGVRPGHHDMVEDADTDERKRVLELSRKGFVGTRWFSDPPRGDYGQRLRRQRCI